MSEFELNLLRQRSLEAARQKARRGELRFILPAGYCWTQHGKIEMDPQTWAVLAKLPETPRRLFTSSAEEGWMRHEENAAKPNRFSRPLYKSAQFLSPACQYFVAYGRPCECRQDFGSGGTISAVNSGCSSSDTSTVVGELIVA